jgi:hypothetical protein
MGVCRQLDAGQPNFWIARHPPSGILYARFLGTFERDRRVSQVTRHQRLKQEEYNFAAVLERLAKRNVYAITSFIFGMDNDTVGAAERTLQQVRSWPPCLPIFGLLTPLPATPLYERLEKTGRLTRPKHWQDFIPFTMAHTPLKMTIEEAHAEVRHAWAQAYSPEALADAVNALDDQPVGYRINGKKLEGNEPAQARVLGLIDHAHAATTEFFDNAVM